MRRTRVLSVAALVPTALLVAFLVSDAAAEMNVETMHKFKQMAAKLSSGYTKYEGSGGDCLVGRAHPPTKSVWVAKLSCAGDKNVAAGFMIGQLTSTTPLSGVKVVATIEVTQIVGTADFNPRFGLAGSAPAYLGKRITQPGTYTASAGPFDLQANKTYEAGAILVAIGSFTAVQARITEIKWDL